MRQVARLLTVLTVLGAAVPAWAERSADRTVTVPPPVRALTEGTGALQLAIGQCWNVAGLTPQARKIRVTVGLNVDAAGHPVTQTIQLVWPKGDNDMDAQMMYQTARRAILRCGRDGLPMPAGRRGTAQRLELTFDATGAMP